MRRFCLICNIFLNTRRNCCERDGFEFNFCGIYFSGDRINNSRGTYDKKEF